MHELPAEARGATRARPRGARLLVLLLLIGLLGLSTKARVDAALRDPLFDARHPEGLLKSDPALLYYVTERIVDAGGRAPDDFRADPRVQHPDLTDLPAEFATGQEFLAAWWHRWLGGGEALHVSCVRAMSLLASLAGLGVFLLVGARARSASVALLATALFLLVPANYRTLGFVLVREDLSFPLYALHLGLLARAAERGSRRLYLASGLALGAGLATWHALGFFAAVELGALHLWFLRKGASPLEDARTWPVLVGPLIAGTLVPALATAGFVLGAPMLLAYALLATALARRRFALARPAALLVAAGTFTVLAALAELLAPGRSGYAHVHDVLVAKLLHLGRLPADPGALSFDARLLWQGPFLTSTPAALLELLGLGNLALFALALALAVRRRARLASFEVWLLAFALLSLPVAWLIDRTVILAGLLVPAASAVVLARIAGERAGRWLLAGAAALQASTFLPWISAFQCAWYRQPPHRDELRALVEWVAENVEPTSAILGDFVNSTAILARSGNPICLQPKYETEPARRKAEAFLTTFFHGTPAELHRLARERFRADYLLVDRFTLGRLSAYTADALGPLEPGSSAAAFLSGEPATFGAVDGFELVYESPAGFPRLPGEPERCFLLYRVR